MRTIFCDEFRKIFKVDEPCCAGCHDEFEDDEENDTDYSVIASDYDIVELPGGLLVRAQLCCAMHNTEQFKNNKRDDMYGIV